MSDPIAILDGKVVDATQAVISVGDAGFVHAAAVAEMVRTFRSRPFRVDDHLDRLARGIDALAIADSPTRQQLGDAIDQVAAGNSRLIPEHHDLGVIVFVTAGMNATYLPAQAMRDAQRCTWGVHSFPLPFENWAGKLRDGQRLMVPPQRAIPAECLDPTMKWRSRVHWHLMDRAVRRTDPQAAAVAVDLNGLVTETSTANILVVREGRIRTPRAENTLDGVSRRVALEIAESCGIAWEWADVTPAELTAADEVILSSTPYCLMPVAMLDGAPIGARGVHPVYDRLMGAWNEHAGLDIIEQIRVVAAELQADPTT